MSYHCKPASKQCCFVLLCCPAAPVKFFLHNFCLHLLQAQGPEGPQPCPDPVQGPCLPSEPFPGLDSSMSLDQKPMYGQAYPGPQSMGMQPGYAGNSMQGQSPGAFNPMMNQMGQTGGFPGMGAMGNPRANMQRPRMMTATKPLRLQLQQRLQGQQVNTQNPENRLSLILLLCFH